MTQVIHNEVTRAILSTDLGTDSARVAKMMERGGQVMIDTTGAFLSVDAVRAMNQKGVMRAVQAMTFMVAEVPQKGDLDPVTASVISAVMLTADQTISYESMRYLAGQSSVIDARIVNGVSRQRLLRFCGRGGTAKTIESKVSRSVGKRGFLTALGIVAKSDAHSFTLQAGAREHGFMLGFATQLQRLSDGQFALIMGDDK